MIPMRTAATIQRRGTAETASAAEATLMPKIELSQVSSAESGLQII